MNYIYHLLVMLGFIVSTVGIGHNIVKKYPLKFELQYLLSYFVGEIIYSFIWIIISSYFGRPVNIILILPILVFYFFKGLKLSLALKLPKRPTKLNINIAFGIVIGIVLLFYFAMTFIRPYEWDNISYRLPVTTELAEGHISFPLLKGNAYSIYSKPFVEFYGNLPFASESYSSILYSMTSMNISSQQLYLVNLVFFLAFITYVLKTRFKLSHDARQLVCLLILLSYGNSILIGTGLVDINMTIYQFLALYCALLYRNQKSFIYLFFLFATYSIANKYTSIYVIFPIFLFILYHTDYDYKKFDMKRMLYALLKLSLIIFISGGYWYIKNIVMYGNPVYPLYLGHRGLDDATYALLMDTQIYGLRDGRSFSDLLNVLLINYKNESGLIIMFLVSIIGLLYKKIVFNTDNKFIVFLCLFIYFFNFFVGSQISRFILIVPILIYILGVQVISKYKYLILIISAIVLLGIRVDPLQWSVWSSRINIVKLLLLKDDSKLRNTYLGCLDNVSNVLLSNNSYAYNLWDPYATSFYTKDSRFVDVPNLNNLSSFSDPKVNYVYINKQYKSSFENNRHIHRDIFIDERLNFERVTLGVPKLELKKDNCELYRIE